MKYRNIEVLRMSFKLKKGEISDPVFIRGKRGIFQN